jgi:RNA polymerase sigma factor (sigma-70 family)
MGRPSLSTQGPSLEEAYRTYRPHLLRVVAALARRGYRSDPLTALDLIHAFFEEEWSRLLETYDPSRGPLRPYIQVAFFRFARRRIVRLGRISSQGMSPSELQRIAGSEGNKIERGVDTSRVRTAMQMLSPLDSDVLESYLEHPSERGVAERLGLTRYQVRESLSRAVGTVAVNLDRPPSISRQDWSVTTEVLRKGRTLAQAASYLGIGREEAARSHARTLKTLLGGLRRAPPTRRANKDSNT